MVELKNGTIFQTPDYNHPDAKEYTMEEKKQISKKSYIVKTKRPNGSIRITTFNEDPSMTDDTDAKTLDINYIMERFPQTGYLPMSTKQALYDSEGLIPRTTDLLAASQLIQDAYDKFDALGSRIKERFANDPTKLIEFLNDPSNKEEAIKLGLLQAKNDKPNDEISPTKPTETATPSPA